MNLHKCEPPDECFYCPKCGTNVVHQPDNPDDTAHCPCRRNRVADCSCQCHVVIGIPA